MCLVRLELENPMVTRLALFRFHFLNIAFVHNNNVKQKDLKDMERLGRFSESVQEKKKTFKASLYQAFLDKDLLQKEKI